MHGVANAIFRHHEVAIWAAQCTRSEASLEAIKKHTEGYGVDVPLPLPGHCLAERIIPRHSNRDGNLPIRDASAFQLPCVEGSASGLSVHHQGCRKVALPHRQAFPFR